MRDSSEDGSKEERSGDVMESVEVWCQSRMRIRASYDGVASL
jgi:hypothetical protein